MEKPNYAFYFIGEVMSNCLEKEPKDRPTFSQLEEIIRGNRLSVFIIPIWTPRTKNLTTRNASHQKRNISGWKKC